MHPAIPLIVKAVPVLERVEQIIVSAGVVDFSEIFDEETPCFEHCTLQINGVELQWSLAFTEGGDVEVNVALHFFDQAGTLSSIIVKCGIGHNTWQCWHETEESHSSDSTRLATELIGGPDGGRGLQEEEALRVIDALAKYMASKIMVSPSPQEE